MLSFVVDDQCFPHEIGIHDDTICSLPGWNEQSGQKVVVTEIPPFREMVRFLGLLAFSRLLRDLWSPLQLVTISVDMVVGFQRIIRRNPNVYFSGIMLHSKSVADATWG